jgi:hypothetical protein
MQIPEIKYLSPSVFSCARVCLCILDEADENSQHFSNTDATIPIATICKAKTEDAAPLQLQKEKRVASPTKSMTNTLPTIVTAPNKRHTVDVTNSLRARLLSSVRRRKTSLIQRHSWQLPKEEKLVVTPEPSKSTRLISWFKHKANSKFFFFFLFIFSKN